VLIFDCQIKISTQNIDFGLPT